MSKPLCEMRVGQQKGNEKYQSAQRDQPGILPGYAVGKGYYQRVAHQVRYHQEHIMGIRYLFAYRDHGRPPFGFTVFFFYSAANMRSGIGARS